jgi:hypothetical protein
VSTAIDVHDLATRFAAATLPRSEWTHLAHMAAGLWHVDRYGPDEARARLRTGIRRLNESHGTANTATTGYHETVTCAYVLLLAAFLDRCPSEMSLPQRAVLLFASELCDRRLLMRFYSTERLMSPKARAEWLEPDVAPLGVDAALGWPGRVPT